MSDESKREAAHTPTDDAALDWPLPCDVKVGNGTHCKGTSLRTLVARMRMLHEAAFGPMPSKEEQAANLAALQSVARAPDMAAELATLRADFAALQHALIGDTGASAILTAANLRAEVERLRAENDKLRAKLGNSPEPCAYCALPADKLLDCHMGFPGCPRADDMMLCGHFGAAMEAAGLRADLDAERRKVEALEKDAERWQPIETADSNALALLYAPPEALFVEPAKHLGEFRVAAPRNWTWATHWMPLPAPPAIDAALSEKGRT